MVGTKRKTILPKAPVARILLDAGAKRVSADAVDVLTTVLEEMGAEMTRHAHRIALHSGRKTIQEQDIALAVKK